MTGSQNGTVGRMSVLPNCAYKTKCRFNDKVFYSNTGKCFEPTLLEKGFLGYNIEDTENLVDAVLVMLVILFCFFGAFSYWYTKT